MVGKGRAPCCDKTKVKRGPWSPAEDLRLVTFIQKHGHENWRSLPKQAGLLRCGKSCRLRWINYLRPDVKRGGFTIEEEDTIINLHQTLGNKWSTIASHFPGRTDNEIKNVWNTHLKKRAEGLKLSRESISNKESSSSSSTFSSSSSTNGSSGEDQRSVDQTQLLDINQQLEEADDQCVTGKAQPNIQELLPSEHDDQDGDYVEEVNNKSPPPEEDRERVHDQDQVQGNDTNNGADQQESPMEVDYDIWEMVEGINYLQWIHGSDITLCSETENQMWVRFLETELGIHHQTATKVDDHGSAANEGTTKPAVDPAGLGNQQSRP